MGKAEAQLRLVIHQSLFMGLSALQRFKSSATQQSAAQQSNIHFINAHSLYSNSVTVKFDNIAEYMLIQKRVQ